VGEELDMAGLKLPRSRVSWLAAIVPILAVAVAGRGVSAAQYYVSPTGSGTACSQAAPCALVSTVISSKVLGGGDVVNIAAGTYYEMGGITLTASDAGASDASRVVFRGAGKNSTFIYGLNSTRVDDNAAARCDAAINCNGEGAQPNVYRINVGSRTFSSGNVWETVWYGNKVRATDDATAASYQFDYPVPYMAAGSVANANSVAGSYFYAAPYLYVRTWDSVAPSVAGTDVEIGTNVQSLWLINGADFITISDLTMSYSPRLLYASGDVDYLTLSNLNLRSAREYGLLFYGTPDNSRVDHVHIDSVQERHGLTSAGKNEYWGVGNNTAGDCASLASSGAALTGHNWSFVDMHSCFNGFATERVVNSTFDNWFVEGFTNHGWRIGGPNADCTNLVFKNSILLNGQDVLYNYGCPNARYLRMLNPAASLTDQSPAPPSGTKFYSSIYGQSCAPGDTGICALPEIQSYSMPGYFADYNWFPTYADRCRVNGTYYMCRDDGTGTDWPDMANNSDRHSVYTTSLTFAGTSWPLRIGAQVDQLTREMFYPVAGSPLIDAGNPDLDGDGVLETGAGGDDECTAAHHCFGTRPDIGPFEYGLDVPAGSGTSIAAPANVRRIDKK
jgi:hypothetical protein